MNFVICIWLWVPIYQTHNVQQLQYEWRVFIDVLLEVSWKFAKILQNKQFMKGSVG